MAPILPHPCPTKGRDKLERLTRGRERSRMSRRRVPLRAPVQAASPYSGSCDRGYRDGSNDAHGRPSAAAAAYSYRAAAAGGSGTMACQSRLEPKLAAVVSAPSAMRDPCAGAIAVP